MDSKNWKILHTRTDYENDYFRIIKHDVKRPDDTDGVIYILDKYTGFFTVILPITPENEVYLVGQYRVPTESYSWEFPMGGVRDATDPLKVAKQELKEETGLMAKHWEQIGVFNLAPGHSRQKSYVFVAKDLEQKEKEPEPGEFLDIKKVPIAKIRDMIKTGEITDGPTISAYYFFVISNEAERS